MEFTIFVRRSALGERRFDENMGVGSWSPWHSDEGPDLILRLQQAGVRCYYEPKFGVWHPQPVQSYGPKEIDRAYRYACGTGYFYRKHKYPLSYFAYYLARTSGGALLALATLKPRKAGFIWPGCEASGGDGKACPVLRPGRCPDMSTGSHIALAHHWLVGMRGGEKVLETNFPSPAAGPDLYPGRPAFPAQPASAKTSNQDFMVAASARRREALQKALAPLPSGHFGFKGEGPGQIAGEQRCQRHQGPELSLRHAPRLLLSLAAPLSLGSAGELQE